MGDARQERAREGEEEAARYLGRRGLAIRERNWRCRAGEMDLVALDGGTVVFVEVKTRSGSGFGAPAEAVTPAKQRRLRQVAAWYLTEKGLHGAPCRFDVVSVMGRPGAFAVEHIPDAF